MSAKDATKEVSRAVESIEKTGETRNASDNLIKDAERHFNWLCSGDDAYLSEMQKLIKDGLLPSVTLAYLDKNFEKANTITPDDKLEKSEVQQFIEKTKDAKNGDKNTPFDRAMYENVLNYMNENHLESIDKSQIEDFRQKAQMDFEKGKVQDAYYHARVLLNKDGRGASVLDRIDSYPPGRSDIDANALREYARRQKDADPIWTQTDEAKAIQWLNNNWNDPVVQKALMENGRIPKTGFDERLNALASRYGLKTDGPVPINSPSPPESTVKPAESPAGDNPAVVPPPNQPAHPANDSDLYPAGQRMRKDNRPDIDDGHKTHNWYFSDGQGNTVALDGKDKKDPDAIILGTVKKGPDGVDKAHYTGWRRDRDNNRWVLYDGNTALATADKVEVDRKTGKVNIIGKYTPIQLAPTYTAQGVM